MSGNAAGRIARMPAWVRYGLIAGIIAFACTLAANTAVTWLQPADLCRAGPLIVPLLSLGALVIFLAMAAAAGFATARAGTSRPDPILAGVLVGAIGGCALVAMLPLIPGVEHRLQELSSLCPGPGSFGGGAFTFNFGPPLPSGVDIPTPPPDAFATPPPGAFAMPSPGGILGDVLQMLVTILVGVVLAVGAASVGGLAGRARRSQVRSGEKP
jgi:hypothetical protein